MSVPGWSTYACIVGLTVPKMLPITGTFALPFSAYYMFLQGRVVYHRFQTGTHIESQSSDAADDVLRAANRAQCNFAENVPLALTLAAIVELNGGSRKLLTGALSALLVFRLLHAEAGIMMKNYLGPGRAVGYVGTQGFIAALSAYAAYLVKGYWDL